MMMFNVRLSRMNHRTKSSIAMVSATIVQTGRRDAIRKPATMARMSQTELRTLSP